MRLLLCCAANSEELYENRHKVKFGQPLGNSFSAQLIPVPIDEIISHLTSSCQLKKKLFIGKYEGNQFKEYYDKMRYGIPFLPEDVDANLLCLLVMTYVKKIPGGIFTKQGEEILLGMVGDVQSDKQYAIYYKALLTMSPAAKQLLRNLLHLWYALTENVFVNNCSIPELSQAISVYLFPSQRSSKHAEVYSEVCKQILMNRRIARNVMYSHTKTDFTGSQDSSMEMDNSGHGESFMTDFSLKNLTQTLKGDLRGSIRSRRDKRLSLLITNMADDANMETMGLNKTLKDVSNQVELSLNNQT